MEECGKNVTEECTYDSLNCFLSKYEEIEDENEVEDDEDDDDDEFGDSFPLGFDVDSSLKGAEDSSSIVQRVHPAVTGRGVTLAMLLADGIIQPGEDAMSIDYLGKKFIADLLPDGKIRWKEAGRVFGSPSAWAIHCKKVVNPMKKSGCGWASVRYKGKKLDVFKSSWFKKHRPILLSGNCNETDDECEDGDNEVNISPEFGEQNDSTEACNSGYIPVRVVDFLPSVRHCTLGRRNANHNLNTLVECSSFMTLAKMQPFNLSISSNCLLMLNFHCHLTSNEVVGYLGGKWDASTQKLIVQSAIPFCCDFQDKERASLVEDNIRMLMEKKGMVVAGWYHSHPKCQPDPSLRDIEAQLEYQYLLKGSPNTFQPCFAVITSPFINRFHGSLSEMQAFCVMPPPEQRPLDYGMPMIVEYVPAQDMLIAEDIYKEMIRLIGLYRNDSEFRFLKHKLWSSKVYLSKLEMILKGHCPNGTIDMRLSEILETMI